MSFENRAIRVLLMLVVLGSVSAFQTADAEEPWEFSPYRIRAWIQMDDHPVLNNNLFEQFKYDVPYFAELMDKSGWQISIEPSPAEFKHLIDRGVENIDITDDQKASGDVRRGDRIAFVHIATSGNEFSIQTRQFDCQTHLWGPTSSKTTIYPSLLPRLLFDSIKETLVPIAKIEKIEGKFVRLRVRASQIMKKVEDGVLVANTDSPGWIDLSNIFLPVVRLNDKDGYIRLKDGIKVYDWTFLRPVEEVRSEIVEDESYIKAEIHGAKRAPLAGRTNRAQRKFALVVRPTMSETKLQLLTREKNPKPIPDKKIYLKYPGEKDSKVIGRTDRKGEIIIKSKEKQVLDKINSVDQMLELQALLRQAGQNQSKEKRLEEQVAIRKGLVEFKKELQKKIDPTPAAGSGDSQAKNAAKKAKSDDPNSENTAPVQREPTQDELVVGDLTTAQKHMEESEAAISSGNAQKAGQQMAQAEQALSAAKQKLNGILAQVPVEPLNLIYIKSGERRILARLPIVPGYFGSLSANMQDDKVRLRAEGVLAGLEFNFMDLTVRRQVLAVRIRNALIKKDHAEARRIYNDYYLGLSTTDSFMIKVDQDKARLTDELKEKLLDPIKQRDQDKQKKLIDKMFTDFVRLVNSKADTSLDGTLNNEIKTVEDGGTYKPSGDNLDTSDIDKNLEEASGS